MIKINSVQLLEQLQEQVRQLMVRVSYLQGENDDILTKSPSDNQWSVAQVLEHLNSYGNYYLPAVKKTLETRRVAFNDTFTPGWLGNYFTKLMRPRHGVISNKMKAPKQHRPAVDLDVREVIGDFLQQQRHLLQLLEKAKETDLNKLRVPISISKNIRLKLGDTLSFLIAHEQRHFVQIENILYSLRGINDTDQAIHLVA